MTTSEEVSLKVYEAYTRQAFRGLACIDFYNMHCLDIPIDRRYHMSGTSRIPYPGPVIEISGNGRRTVANARTLHPCDENRDIIRIDSLTRRNIGVVLSKKPHIEIVKVRKVKAVPAEKVIVAPLETLQPIKIGTPNTLPPEHYLSNALETVPLIKGDNVSVPYFGGELSFQVIGVTPVADAVLVTLETIFNIVKKWNVEDMV